MLIVVPVLALNQQTPQLFPWEETDLGKTLMRFVEEPNFDDPGLVKKPVLLRYRPKVGKKTFSLLDVPLTLHPSTNGGNGGAFRLALTFKATSQDNARALIQRQCSGPLSRQVSKMGIYETFDQKNEFAVGFRGRIIDNDSEKGKWQPFEFVAFPQTILEPGETFYRQGRLHYQSIPPGLSWQYQGLRTVRGLRCAQLVSRNVLGLNTENQGQVVVWVRIDSGETVEARHDQVDPSDARKPRHSFRYFFLLRN